MQQIFEVVENLGEIADSLKKAATKQSKLIKELIKSLADVQDYFEDCANKLQSQDATSEEIEQEKEDKIKKDFLDSITPEDLPDPDELPELVQSPKDVQEDINPTGL